MGLWTLLIQTKSMATAGVSTRPINPQISANRMRWLNRLAANGAFRRPVLKKHSNVRISEKKMAEMKMCRTYQRCNEWRWEGDTAYLKWKATIGENIVRMVSSKNAVGNYRQKM
jgi:hypothetical protein